MSLDAIVATHVVAKMILNLMNLLEILTHIIKCY